MQTRIDCRFPDATWLALTHRAATLLTAICGLAPGSPTQLSKETRHGLLLSIDNR
jgi:hypothetical protein